MIVGNMIGSLEIYIKIGPRRVRSRVAVRSGKLGTKSVDTVPRKGKDKGANKGTEYSEDDEATLQKVRKPIHPLSTLIVQVNHLARHEDNPAFLSLSGPQVPELFRIRDGEMWFNLPHSKPKPKATGTVMASVPVRHMHNWYTSVCFQEEGQNIWRDTVPTRKFHSAKKTKFLKFFVQSPDSAYADRIYEFEARGHVWVPLSDGEHLI